jgi:hypothetical protein
VLPLPHWEKRKSLLIRRLAQREVRSRACIAYLGFSRDTVSMSCGAAAASLPRSTGGALQGLPALRQ